MVSPTAGTAMSTFFTTSRSGGSTVTGAHAVLFAAFTSAGVERPSDAQLVMLLPDWPTLIVAFSTSVDDAPSASVAIVHWPVSELYEPLVGVAETNVTPAGNASLIVTEVAVPAPRFVTFTA